MFERFTDRARRVVVTAQEESRRHDHAYIGTEHLLAGLVHDEEGVAATVLRARGITPEIVGEQITQVVGDKLISPAGHIPFTPRCKKVLELSLQEALSIGHNYIGTEHLLLALLREGEGVGMQILLKLGHDGSTVRSEVFAQLGLAVPKATEPRPIVAVSPETSSLTTRRISIFGNTVEMEEPLFDVLFTATRTAQAENRPLTMQDVREALGP